MNFILKDGQSATISRRFSTETKYQAISDREFVLGISGRREESVFTTQEDNKAQHLKCGKFKTPNTLVLKEGYCIDLCLSSNDRIQVTINKSKTQLLIGVLIIFFSLLFMWQYLLTLI